MSAGRPRTEMVLDIRAGLADLSDDLVLDGWGQAEGGHRWTLGDVSTIWLPVGSLGDDCILAIDLRPWCDPLTLPAQRVTLALNGKMLASVQLGDQRALAFRCPVAPGGTDGAVLSLTHHDAGRPRADDGFGPGGAPFGVCVFSIRVFRMHMPRFGLLTRAAFPGNLEDGVLAETVLRETGLALKDLAACFENIGHNCELGLMQRALGAEPISLLRFAAVITCRLYDSLISGFAGIGNAANIDISIVEIPGPEFRIHELSHWFFYETGQTPEQTTPEAVRAEQSAHLQFMQRKFLKALRSGEKIYGISRGRNLTEPEALAIWCALNLHAENDLLWALNGDINQTGRVDALLPGFFRGHLGATDNRKYGTLVAWISLMANAWLLRQGKGEAAVFAVS
jgi:hypothetical protein